MTFGFLRSAPHFAVTLCLPAALLAGCSLFDSPNTPIPSGERITLGQTGSAMGALQPTADALTTPLLLPDPVANNTWQQLGGTASRAVGHLALPGTVKPTWETQAFRASRDDTPLPAAPLVLANNLIIFTPEGDLMALNRQTGRVKWQVNLQEALKAPDPVTAGGMASDGSVVYVTTNTGYVAAILSESGHMIWQKEVGQPISAAPTVYGDQLFVKTIDNQTLALATRDGGAQWLHQGPIPLVAARGSSAVSVRTETAVVTYAGGDVHALKADSGEHIWHHRLPTLTGEGATLRDVLAAPIVDRNQLFVATNFGNLAAFRLTDGRKAWQKPLSVQQTPWLAGTVMFVLTTDNELLALNRRDGQPRWRVSLNNRDEENSPVPNTPWFGAVLAGNRLFVVRQDGLALTLNPTDGTVLRQSQLKGKRYSKAPVVANEVLYFVSDGGLVQAYR